MLRGDGKYDAVSAVVTMPFRLVSKVRAAHAIAMVMARAALKVYGKGRVLMVITSMIMYCSGTLDN